MAERYNKKSHADHHVQFLSNHRTVAYSKGKFVLSTEEKKICYKLELPKEQTI